MLATAVPAPANEQSDDASASKNAVIGKLARLKDPKISPDRTPTPLSDTDQHPQKRVVQLRRQSKTELERISAMSNTDAAVSILDDARGEEREHILELLTKAYWMEIETVMNYVSGSINPDGVRAREVAASLKEDILEELGHAQLFGQRIKELYGVVPSSTDFVAEQDYLTPPEHQTELVGLIRGVIEAESGAIDHYTRVIAETEGVDPVTQDMVISILRDEQKHRRLFEGFLREFEQEGRD
jgi:bacterioferritin